MGNDHIDKHALLQAVSHSDPTIRYTACRTLDHHELDDAVVQRMAAALSDPNRKVRHAALHTLTCAACKPPQGFGNGLDVVGAVLQVLRTDRSLRVRRAAVGALMWQSPMELRVRRAFHRVLRDETDAGLRSRAERAIAFADAHRRATSDPQGRPAT